MTLKLNGSSAGSVSIDAPADTSPTGTDVTLTLPTSAGSSGQYLQTNGSGTLSWQTVASDAITEGNTSVEVVDTGSDGEVRLTTEGTRAMTIDSSQNVGIGTSTPASDALLTLQGTNRNIFFQSDGAPTDCAIDCSGGRFVFRGGASGTTVASISEQMRLDENNRLMLGTTTEGHPNADDFTIAGSGNAGMTIRSGSTSVGGIFFSDATSGSGEYDGYIEYNQNTRSMSFGVAAADALRINEGGVILVGSSSTWDSSGSGQSFYIDNTTDRNVLKLSNSDAGSAPYGLIGFYRNKGSVIGRITTDGSTITYGTSSDYRLKENVVDLDGAITRVKQLAPKRFNWIADETDSPVDGFLAHEAQLVVPEAVVGEKDEVDDEGNPVYQGIDQSKLVPLLTAALQEAITKIETLETANASLEARLTALEGGAA